MSNVPRRTSTDEEDVDWPPIVKLTSGNEQRTLSPATVGIPSLAYDDKDETS